MRWVVIPLILIIGLILIEPILGVLNAIWELFGACADLLMPLALDLWQRSPTELHPLWGLMCCCMGILVWLGILVVRTLNRFRGWL